MYTATLSLLTAVLLQTTVQQVSAQDPCAKIAGKTFAPPADTLACFESFSFNETLRQNVLTAVDRIFNFYTFEDYYLSSPAPFQESTVNIREELARINSTVYATDYAFNRDLYDFVNQLNDGHTLWYPYCYTVVQNLLPAPVIGLEVNGLQDVYIAPDSVEFVSQLGTDYTDYFDSINFDWKRLAGAKVLQIEGESAYDYIDYIAKTRAGNYLDHGVRVNAVFTSYQITESNYDYAQHFGTLAGPLFPDQQNLTFQLIPVNSTTAETVIVPFLASYGGENFTDSASYWENNCLANANTNGVDYLDPSATSQKSVLRRPIGALKKNPSQGVGLPPTHKPTLTPLNGSEGAIKSYILPDNETAVMFVGTFSPPDFDGFQSDVKSAIDGFAAAGAKKLLIDLTDNGGGYIDLGFFLFQYLAGSSKISYPGFQSTSRANLLAQKILAANIAQNITSEYSYYTADNFAFLNDTQMPATYNYYAPTEPLTVNGVEDVTSQRYHDTATSYFSVEVPASPYFDPANIAIATNGACASTCAMFSTLLFEELNTQIGVFGGRPGQHIEYKGMAGNQVLEWFDIDSEIKTAGLKDDPLAPPDLLVSADFRHNWRTAWSYKNEQLPIAYESESPQRRFAYTADTYMNPQNLWTFAAKELLGSNL